MREDGALTTSVEYDVAVSVAFEYLAEPRNRPHWQSSLRAVELLDDGEPRVGLRWRDLTFAGIAPEMVITQMQPDLLWAETGRWKGIEAELELAFSPGRSRSPGDQHCSVTAVFVVHGRGLLRPLGRVATRAGLFAVRSDLRRAGRNLSRRSS